MKCFGVYLCRACRVGLDFVFNVGGANFRHSTLLSAINARELDRVEGQFNRWVLADGKPWPGLVTPRQREIALFFTGVEKPPSDPSAWRAADASRYPRRGAALGRGPRGYTDGTRAPSRNVNKRQRPACHHLDARPTPAIPTDQPLADSGLTRHKTSPAKRASGPPSVFGCQSVRRLGGVLRQRLAGLALPACCRTVAAPHVLHNFHLLERRL